VLEGGTDEEILEWCYTNGRRLNERDVVVWNSFISKFGLKDFMSGRLVEMKKANGVADRDDIQTITELMDYEEGRVK
jgi:gluconokinase